MAQSVGSIFFFLVDLGKAANFPYATIDPEVCRLTFYLLGHQLRYMLQEARIPVPDTRFDWLCELYKPASRVPAHLTCIDIAGLTAVSHLVTQRHQDRCTH